MALLNLNKTGLWTLLVLQLLCFSLYPACGRPRFEDEDEDIIADEDHDQHDEDQVEAQDEDQGEEEEYEENDPTTPKPGGGAPGGGAPGGGAPGGGTSGSGTGGATGTAVKRGPDGKVISETAATKDELLDE